MRLSSTSGILSPSWLGVKHAKDLLRLMGMISTLGACASVARPPGGPDDKAPPEIADISIDTNATNVSAGKIEVRFDEVIGERPAGVGGGSGSGPVTLEAIVIVSPRTGSAKVEWHRDRITIEPRGGFRPNTTYRITLLPGIADVRGNVKQTAASIVFTTGAALDPYSILGRVFDWESGVIAPLAIVEAVANPDSPDSLIHVAVADSTGQFELGPLGAGKYLVRTFIDADRNRERGVVEKWDSLTVTVTDHRPAVELLAAQRDTAPIGIARVEVMDSTWIRLTLDKPFDPRTTLQPALVVLKRADSLELPVLAVMTNAQANFLRPTGDSIPTPPPAAPPLAADSLSMRPPAPRPRLPSPERIIVLRLNPTAALRPGERYAVTLRAIRNLVGKVGATTMEFDAPRPAPRPPG